MANSADRGPYVAAILVCDEIRPYDDGEHYRLIVGTAQLEIGDSPVEKITIPVFVSVYGGDLRGKHEAIIRVEAPDGAEVARAPVELDFGTSRAVTSGRVSGHVDVPISRPLAGVYYFDLLFAGTRLGRTAFTFLLT